MTSSNHVVRRNLTDDYELLQKIGIGSYGEVYKSRNIRTGEAVAVKMVKIGTNSNFSLIQQEVTMLKDCSHPNIISYYGSYFHKDALGIVMEYCNGGSLHDIYKMTGALNELQIAFICRETLKGLQYLNSKNQVHRDIKAANILLTNSGDVKLADFGIAVQISATIGKCKSFIGTPYWMAPEVASVDDNGGYGFPCDVWSVGITAIELAELAPPHYELSPMRVLHLLAKSSFKPPKLKDKKKWSHIFHDFVKICLIKNPKKRPSPDKLLQSHHFVCGSLSPRFTKELLDRVNNPASARETKRLHDAVEGAFQQELGADLDIERLSKELSGDTETESSSHSEQTPEPIRSYQNGLTLPVKQYGVSTSNNTLFDNVKGHDDDSEYSTPRQNFFDNLPPPMFAQRVHHPSSGSKRPSIEHHVEEVLPRSVRANLERSATLEGNSPATQGAPLSIKNRMTQFDLQTSFSRSANSCSYGLVSCPSVNMGAGFCTVIHDCHLRINSCDIWTHPANNKKFLVIGAEEGIFIHDLTYLGNENVVQQISDRRCSEVFIIEDTLMAVQGKTQYVYRHDVLQLYHQQSIFQKYSKRLATLTEKYKKLLVRLPETKNLFKFTVERSVINNNLYMAIAVPQEIILYLWFEPRKSFVQLKSVSASVPRTAPFNFFFDTGALNADYPQICIGVFDRQKANSDTDTDDVRPKETDEVNLYYQLVDFNDHGKLEHFVAKSVNSDLYDTLRPLGQNGSTSTYTDRNRRNVVALKQLDRDTFFIAFESQAVITNSQGTLKQTNLMQTLFNVDFKITAAFPLADSVLLFHENGLKGLSLFNSSITTQELEDPTKIYTVISTEKMIVLRCRSLLPRPLRPNNSFPAPNARFPLISSIVSSSKNEVRGENPTDPGEDVCLLIGHVETNCI